MTTILWPRLPQYVGRSLVKGYRSMSTEELTKQAAVSHSEQTYASSGGVRATPQQLRAVRDVIEQVAKSHGFPDPPTDPVRFDRDLAPALLDVMPMVDGEALNRDVWTFTATVLAPDITYWRFVRGESWNLERWVCTDRTRHMFARLWWQARQLTTPTESGRDTALLDSLSESELNHITERTSIGGCAPLARALVRRLMAAQIPGNRREVVRNSCLLLLRLMAFVDPYALEDDDLDRLADAAISAAIDGLSRPERP